MLRGSLALLTLAAAAAAGAYGYALWSRGTVVQLPSPRTAAAAPAPAPPPRSVVRPRPVAAGEAEKPAGPAFEYEYVAPRSPGLRPVHERVRDADLLRELPEVHAIDGLFLLPRRLRYVTAECGQSGAFYVPETAEVVLCYETLKTLYERGEEQREAGKLDAEFPLRYTRANVRFIVLHETGHALVDLLDLPITGREEDAVDQLAAMLMLRFAGLDETPAQTVGNLRMAADWMLAHGTGAYNLDAYADEHALGEQRYFNLQCLIYGTDPAKYVGIVVDGDLPQARAAACPRETRKLSRAWLRLLLPHLAPKYEMTEAEATRFFEKQQRERERNGAAPYLRGDAGAP